LGDTWTLLVSAAAVAAESPSIPRRDVLLEPSGWEALAGDAESARLSPLVHAFLEPQRHDVPEAAMRQLDALALRHRVWHRERAAALIEILQALERISVKALVLKGGALAWMIYASPALRPMGDLDILVSRRDARPVQSLLARLGFHVQPGAQTFRRNAHSRITCWNPRRMAAYG
jgi:hypothetical protein